MVNPWVEWQRLIRAGTMIGETWVATQQVVEHRSKAIEGALADPIHADHAELTRMVTEKGTAFGNAGASLARDWWAMQADLGAQAVAVGNMMMGKIPSPSATQATITRAQRLASAALSSSVRAMAPVHRVATANAKRLSKKR